MYKAILDTKGKIYSYIGISLFVLITILLLISIQSNDLLQILGIWLIFLLLFSIPYLRCIIGYSITSKNIIIHRHFRNILICKNEIINIEIIEPNLLNKNRRVFNDGGLLGYTGTYSNEYLGIIEMYCTNLQEIILITTAQKSILISPNGVEDFVKEITP